MLAEASGKAELYAEVTKGVTSVEFTICDPKGREVASETVAVTSKEVSERKLPVVRTSPDHGTAYGLAGKNEADATSMLHAIYTAIDILRERSTNEQLEAGKLIWEPKVEKREYHVEKFVPKD